jgi:imidazolonepropionase-like amidohydrolase
VSQLQTIWPKFLETNPDHVKIYYFNEEGIDDQVPGNHGLRLPVAKAIIDSAYASGLRVFAHVETRKDFETMVDAGVDGFAHMPGYFWSGDTKTYDTYYLPDALLQKAADNNVVIIPTAALNGFRNRNDEAAFNVAVTFQNDLISRYRAMGGTIAAGTDVFAQTAGILYSYYAEHIDLPAGEKLDLLTTETTRVILPDIQTGRISDGYKADFLVFSKKPFESGSWEKPEYVYFEGRLVAENRPAN